MDYGVSVVFIGRQTIVAYGKKMIDLQKKIKKNTCMYNDKKTTLT